MCVSLVCAGYPPNLIYSNYSYPLISSLYLTLIKVEKRKQQVFSSTFASSIGLFFTKKNEKNIIEELEEELFFIDKIFGEKLIEQKMTEEEKIEHKNSLFGRFVGAIARSKRK